MALKPVHNGTMQRPTHFIAPELFDDADAALQRVLAIYEQSLNHLREAMRRYVAGEPMVDKVRACYPFVRIHTHTAWSPPKSLATERLSYGFVASAGRYETTLTRPDLFAYYLRQQFGLLLANHGGALEVGTSQLPIPVHFSFAENDHIEGEMSAERRAQMRDIFDLPDLMAMDDGIANGTYEPAPGQPAPLSLFTAPALTIRCNACATTRAPLRTGFKTMCCSPITSFTLTNLSLWGVPRCKTRAANTSLLWSPATW